MINNNNKETIFSNKKLIFVYLQDLQVKLPMKEVILIILQRLHDPMNEKKKKFFPRYRHYKTKNKYFYYLRIIFLSC